MSNAPSTSTSASTEAAAGKPVEESRSSISALEEDDDFEDFEAEDWEENKTFGASLAGGKGDAKKGLNSLWEDNWDDDDVGDDFSVQLRGELAKQNEMQS
ncbi:hypothetical protein T439DRAFT_327846 [Meredithblackwellia eburnea MCA 4105]